jgi:hypothetical protein
MGIMAEVKMDISNMEPVSIWIQSLGLLFQACEPLTYDCIRSKTEYAALVRNIERHAYYCADVKDAIDNGRLPKTWDEWNNRGNVPVEGVGKMVNEIGELEPIDTRGFSNTLTDIFNVGLPRKTV